MSTTRLSFSLSLWSSGNLGVSVNSCIILYMLYKSRVCPLWVTGVCIDFHDSFHIHAYVTLRCIYVQSQCHNNANWDIMSSLINHRYSQGTGTTWLDELRCTSSDLMLSTCSHNGFGNENCLHSEDVAVICNTISSTGECNFRLSYDCCAAQNKHHQAHYYTLCSY